MKKHPEYLVFNPFHSKLYSKREPFTYCYENVLYTDFFNEIKCKRVIVEKPLIIKHQIKNVQNIEEY